MPNICDQNMHELRAIELEIKHGYCFKELSTPVVAVANFNTNSVELVATAFKLKCQRISIFFSNINDL